MNKKIKHEDDNEKSFLNIKPSFAKNYESNILKFINNEGFKKARYVSNIGNVPNPNKYLYKYIKIEFVKKWLNKNGDKSKSIIRFDEPTKWKDRYEARFYTAHYKNHMNEFTPALYALSMTMNSESEASWLVYSNGNANDCVRLVFSLSKLRKALDFCMAKRKAIGKSTGMFYLGEINYRLDNHQIKCLNKKTYKEGCVNTCYEEIFENKFCLENYLSLLLIKHRLFKYEQELRVFYVPNTAEQKEMTKEHAKSIDFDIDLMDCLVRIDIQKNATERNFFDQWAKDHNIGYKQCDMYGEQDENGGVLVIE